MRTGKTQQQIDYIREYLKEKESVLVVGIKSPADYLDRLGEGYEAEEVFSRVAEKLNIGYKFRKI